MYPTTDPEPPWLIDINPVISADNVNWSSVQASDATVYLPFRFGTGAQNQEVSWPVVLSAGVWTVQLTIRKASSYGIINVQLDGVTVGTIDAYNGSTLDNQTATITGIAVTSGGKKVLRLINATKNGSSSGYNSSLEWVRLIRTA